MRRRKPEPTITFACEPEWHGVLVEPVPAAKMVPEWLKKMERHIPQGDELPGDTIKSCMPVLDAYQAGYMIMTSSPVRVVVTEDNVHTTWRPGTKAMIESHSAEQVAGSGWQLPALKWLNPWLIKTAPGYSCIITHPFNRSELPFQTLTGVVDTDAYPNQINLPFIWSGPRPYDDIIPEGTPIAQVVPFRREQPVMSVRAMADDELEAREKATKRLSTRNHGYRDLWRSRKIWR